MGHCIRVLRTVYCTTVAEAAAVNYRTAVANAALLGSLPALRRGSEDCSKGRMPFK